MTTSKDDQNDRDAQESPLHETSRRSITTEEGFHEAIDAIVTAADSNGVDVRGDWPVVGDNEDRMWDVEISRLSRRSIAHVLDTGYPAASIIEAVAAREDIDKTELPPLFDAIGSDILETLNTTPTNRSGSVTFQYYGYTITVDADGTIIIDG